MYYHVQISEDKDFSTLVVNITVEDTTDASITKDLEYFTVYWWRVKAVDPMTGATSEWSVPCAFRIKGEDITIHHDLDSHSAYILYGSNCFGLNHEFIKSTDSYCEIPDAQIGVCVAKPAPAEIGVVCCNDNKVGYCTGVCTPKWDGVCVELLLTENSEFIMTEDGYVLALEY